MGRACALQNRQQVPLLAFLRNEAQDLTTSSGFFPLLIRYYAVLSLFFVLWSLSGTYPALKKSAQRHGLPATLCGLLVSPSLNAASSSKLRL